MKKKYNIRKILTYTITFICGILFVVLLLKFSDIINVEPYAEISSTIAIVNQDIVGDGYDFSFGDKIVDMFDDSDEYNFIVTSYQDAEDGTKGYLYSGYVLIDSNFTNSMYSVNREIPSRGKISYKINPNLDDEDKKDVEDYILSELYEVNNNINYLYISSILEVLHGSQDNVIDVLANEDEVDRILKNIDNYNEEYYNSSKEFLESLENKKDDPKDGGTFEMDPINILDLKFDSKGIQDAITSFSDDYSGNMAELTTELENIFSTYGKTIMSSNSDLQNIESDDIYTDFLNKSVSKLDNLNTFISKTHEIYTYFDELDLTQYIKVVDFFDEMYENANNGDLVAFQEQINSDKFQKFITFLNDFKNSYLYWSTHSDSGCFDSTTSPATGDPKNCMAPFIGKYNSNKAINEYLKIEKAYKNLVEFVDSKAYTYIKNEYDSYVTTLGGAYIDFKQKAPFNSIEEAYNGTTELCLNIDDESSNILTDFSCEWNKFLSTSAIEHINIKEISKEELLDNIVSQDVEIVQSVVDNQKGTLNILENGIPSVSSSIKSGVEQVFSPEAIEGIESSINSVKEEKSTLEDKIYDNKVSSQENINEVTKEFRGKYPEIAKGLDENDELLLEFASLFENSKNAEGSNYFLYDFISNPIEVKKQADSQRLIPIDRTALDRKKTLELTVLSLALAGSSGIYFDIRRRYKQKGKKPKEYDEFEI